jgi:hypothetical protein
MGTAGAWLIGLLEKRSERFPELASRLIANIARMRLNPLTSEADGVARYMLHLAARASCRRRLRSAPTFAVTKKGSSR